MPSLLFKIGSPVPGYLSIESDPKRMSVGFDISYIRCIGSMLFAFVSYSVELSDTHLFKKDSYGS